MSFPRVGAIGAGQLARMMAVPANNLGIDLTVFTANSEDSAAQIADYVLGDYRDVQAVLAFAQDCDVVTFEHELVPPSIIKAIADSGVKVYPKAESFLYSQNKIEMRKKMADIGLPNPKHQIYEGSSLELTFPFIAKLPAGGYDGRGGFMSKKQSDRDELEKSNGTV